MLIVFPHQAITPTVYFLCILQIIFKGDRYNGLLLMHLTHNLIMRRRSPSQTSLQQFTHKCILHTIPKGDRYNGLLLVHLTPTFIIRAHQRSTSYESYTQSK
ncbi:hypothetical protein PQG02_09470 [Nostoc sp. UHCC 0926]|uniref:hypothetical protein n=1 Tax=unclassified Nostoc TaxID=2593658 RepID=UPI0023612063|nr:hypothetical protein [Nostoc sp. UHCC 0926]WDD34527.1 hypothetical protein PQG02_09470 [Nostoc sp. UHCC 0926]